MSDPLDPEPGKESSMENQQEMTADQVIKILLFSKNYFDLIDLFILDYNNARHD